MNIVPGTTIAMKVKQSAQAASGGSYLVQFEADIEIKAAPPIEVSVESVYPNDPDQSDVEEARQAIRNVCAEVLGPINCGAHVVVHELAIHPVDFRPEKHSRWTAIALQRQLDNLSSIDS